MLKTEDLSFTLRKRKWENVEGKEWGGDLVVLKCVKSCYKFGLADDDKKRVGLRY